MLRNKRVRLVLAVFMLPLSLVLMTANAANAATSELLTVDLDGGYCVVPLALQPVTGGSNVVVGTGGYCKGGPDGTPGFCSIYEAPCTTATISIQGVTGSECGSSGWEGISSSGTIAKKLVMGSTVISIGTCEPVQVCVTLSADPTGPFGTSTESGCAATALDQPTVPEVNCAAVANSIAAPRVFKREVIQEGNNFRGRITYNVGFPSSPSATLVWAFYFLATGPTQGADTRMIQGGSTLGFRAANVTRVPGSQPGYTHMTESGLLTEQQAWGWVNNNNARGLGIYLIGNGNPASLSNVPRTAPQGANQAEGLLGVTDPARCSFYWGEKIAEMSDPASTMDEPEGPVIDDEAPVIPDPPPVPPEDPEPTSGLDFGWLAALLGKLIDAVTGLVGAILDGLKALFIPSQGFLDNRINNLSTSWDNTAIGKLGTALGGITPGGVSGCGGMPLVVDFGNGVTISESIGAACSGSMASAAGMVRMALSAVLVLGGAVACVRAVGSGFGWNPGIGQGNSS